MNGKSIPIFELEKTTVIADKLDKDGLLVDIHDTMIFLHFKDCVYKIVR